MVMKMLVYWLAKDLDSKELTGLDCMALAGPYPTWDDAYYAKELHFEKRNAKIVEQLVEVKS